MKIMMGADQQRTALILSGLFPLHAAAFEIGKVDPASIHTPNRVKTSIGTLKFIDGAPPPKTAEKVYEYLDTTRGVDACLPQRVLSGHTPEESITSRNACPTINNEKMEVVRWESDPLARVSGCSCWRLRELL
jgi:hypothetical protein